MHGRIRRFAMAAGAAALTLGSGAGGAISTETSASAVPIYRIPGAPQITGAAAGNGQATVAFTSSAADQRLGNPITSYTVTVYAANAAGNGPPSDPFNPVTPAPAGMPSPPQGPGAATLDQAAYVSCLPPADDGGSVITAYTVTSSPGEVTATGMSCPILVTGLTDGTRYTFAVTATNADGGTSEPSQAAGPGRTSSTPVPPTPAWSG